MFRFRWWLLGLACVCGIAQAGIDLRIEGLPDELADNVRARLSIADIADAQRLSQRRVERAHERANEEIASALQPYGYYSPTVDKTLSGEAPNWQASYRIDPGAPTQLERWEVSIEGEGKDRAALSDIVQRLRSRPAQRLLHSDYASAKRQLEDAAYRAGFLDAQYRTAQLQVDPELRTATALLVLDSGPLYRFGEVSLDIEDDFIDEALIRRYVVIRPGTAFDPQALIRQQFVLGDLDYFANVDIVPHHDQADAERRVPLQIRLTPRKRSRWNFGVGYGTDTGARATVANQWRWVNRSGHKIFSDLRFSEVKNTLSGEYRIPQGQQAGEHLSFNAGAETEELASGDSEKYLLGVSLNRDIGAWQRRYYLEYTHEISDFGETLATADLFTPGISLTRAELDDTIWARRGWYLFVDLHGAERTLLSTSSFVQTRMLGRGALPLPAGGRLLGRAELGLSLVDDFDELPASQRFFAGGDQSVRGYAYQSLAPRDENDEVVGGRYLQAFSLESEFPVWKAFGAALFVDAGGASDEPSPDLSVGVGAGLRYRAPFGSVQVDLAHPLESSGVRLHLGVRVGL